MNTTSTFAVIMICMVTIVTGFAFDGFADENIMSYGWLYKSLVYAYITGTIVVGFQVVNHLAFLLSMPVED